MESWKKVLFAWRLEQPFGFYWPAKLVASAAFPATFNQWQWFNGFQSCSSEEEIRKITTIFKYFNKF